MAKIVRVISEFQHRETGQYVRPGADCPKLDEETQARLVRAGCIVVVEAEATGGKKAPAGGKKAPDGGEKASAEKPPEE